MTRHPLAVLGLVATTISAPALADPATEALARRLDQLSQQVDALKAQVQQLKAQNEALANQLEGQPAVAATQPSTGAVPAQTPPTQGPVVATLPGVLEHASLFGYGEINYNRYDHAPQNTEADLRRAVFGIGYRFDEDTRFVSEFEVEHAVASAGDSGEFEVEQFYIDHHLNSWVNLKAGLFLIPSGYINLTHEPPRFFGVERNFVETAIIPSTWREGGVGAYGTALDGLSWDVGVTTGFNISSWDYSDASEGRESPLGSIHQELQLARASDLAQYAALNYNGLPGFNLGASVFSGEARQSQAGIEGHPRTTLWEAHTRWTPGRFDLSALYAKGTISDTGALNLINVGQATPIPDAFHGWYVQGAYRVWDSGKRSLWPFVRYERFNTADGFAAQPAGLGSDALPTETVHTYGANFYLNPNVVFKADYQQFNVNKDMNRFDLGLGFMFY